MQRYLIIKQFISGWVELIKIPVEDNPTKEEITKGIEEIKEIIFNADKINFITDTEAVVFRAKDGPIRIEYSSEI